MRYEILDIHGRVICHTLDEAIHLAVHRMAEDGKLRVLMLWDKKQLLHEIASTAWVESDSATETPETSQATDASTHNYKEVAEEDNWPIVSRWVDLGINEAEQMLYNLTRRHTHWHRSMDNQVNKMKEFAMELRVYPEASESTIDLIMGLVNEYLKARVLKEWAGISYKPALPYWAQKVEELAAQIREAGRSCESMHHVKRPMWPAW